MATATWSWSGSKTNINEKISLSLTGSGISGDAIIRRITYEVDVRANKYSTSCYWNLCYLRVEEGPSWETDITQQMTGTRATIYCEDTEDNTLYDVYRSTTLDILLWLKHTHYNSTVLEGVRITVDYDVPGVTISDFSVSQEGSRYLFSWNPNIIAVENVRYDIYRFLSDGQLDQELDTLTGDSIISTLSKIPRTDYGNLVSFYIMASWEYNNETSHIGVRSNSIIPEFIPIYVRYYRDGVGHDCSVNCYDGEKKEWLECEVNYYDGEKWVECSTI